MKIALALELIDDPKADTGAVAEAIAALSSERPQLVVDLTDPPTLPRYMLGDREATGATADDAADALAAALRPEIAALSRAATLPDVIDLATASVQDDELAAQSARAPKVG